MSSAAYFAFGPYKTYDFFKLQANSMDPDQTAP